MGCVVWFCRGVFKMGWFLGLYPFVPGLGLLCSYFLVLLLSLVSVHVPYQQKFLDSFYLFFLVLSPAVCFFLVVYWTRPVSTVAHFVPEGISGLVGGVVCLFETLSHIARPFVLLLRPTVNIIGGSVVLGGCYWGLNFWGDPSGFLSESVVVCLLSLFLIYEWCVSCVQSYVFKILVEVELSLGLG